VTGYLKMVNRELRLAIRQGADSLMVASFFLLVGILFPLGVGPGPAILGRISAGVIWVAALLAAMLAMERMFHADYEDGSLDLLATSSVPLEVLVAGKITAHWLTTGLPLIIMSPVIGLLLNMDAAGYGVMILALALGTPTMSLLGAVGAALILGARRGGVLLSLLILPLFIPILIFGVGAIEATLTGITPRPQLLILSGFLVASIVLAPWTAAAAVRQAVE
jgi:heme exporter protein B